MAIEDIFKALEEQADGEVNQILHAATVQSDAIEREAREEADRITAGRIAAAEESVRLKAAKNANAAKLQARREMAVVRDMAVDEAFAEASVRLAAMRGTPEYERVFAALAAEALEGISGECEVQVARADVALAEKAIKKLGVKANVTGALDTIGGLVVSTSGGRVVRRNTFEARLAKVRSVAAAQIAEVLTS